jgi:tetratricopeptide (TPR) repeat protein
MARSNWLIVAGRPEEALKVLDRFAVKAADAGAVSLTVLQRSIQTAKAHLARNDALSVIATLTPTREEFERSSLRTYLKTYEADTLLLIAKARLLLGQPVSARPDFERALSLFQEVYDRARSPDVADAQVALANCYLELGQPGKAQALFGSAEAIQAIHRELGVQYTEPLRKLRARLGPRTRAR